MQQTFSDTFSFADSEEFHTCPENQKKGKWTAEEDSLLYKYAPLYNEKNWHKIASFVPGRSSIQCLHRWTKILKPGLIKGMWTPDEDQILIQWVQENGPNKWSQCAYNIEGRNGKQCRDRWFNHLSPEVKKGEWSHEEDQLIFDLYMEHGSSWSKIAKFIPSRTENSIKNRFYSTLRKIANDRQKAQNPRKHQRMCFQDNTFLYGLLESRAFCLDDGNAPEFDAGSDNHEILNVRGQKYLILRSKETNTQEDIFNQEPEEQQHHQELQNQQSGDFTIYLPSDNNNNTTSTTESFEDIQKEIFQLCSEGYSNISTAFSNLTSTAETSSSKKQSSDDFNKSTEMSIAKQQAQGRSGMQLRRAPKKKTSNGSSQKSFTASKAVLDESTKGSINGLLKTMKEAVDNLGLGQDSFSCFADSMLDLQRQGSNSSNTDEDKKIQKMNENLSWLESLLNNTQSELQKISAAHNSYQQSEESSTENSTHKNDGATSQDYCPPLMDFDKIEESFLSFSCDQQSGYPSQDPFNIENFEFYSCFNGDADDQLFKKVKVL